MSALRLPAHRSALVGVLRQRLSTLSLSSQLPETLRLTSTPTSAAPNNLASSSSSSSSFTPSSSSPSPSRPSQRLLHTSSSRRQAAAVEGTVAASADPASVSDEPTAVWTPKSQRVGLIAVKRGMTSFFLPNGERIPATVLQVHSNQVSAHIGFDKEPAENAYTAIQVAAIDSKTVHHVSKQVRGHLQKANISTGKKYIREFRVSRDAIVPLGTQLSAVHFVPGQSIDVRAITRGKGFQGAMKRWDFHGLRASHGVSISHRSHGSTGHSQDPGRVYPGKKMAGRMGGNKHSTIHNLLVLRVDSSTETILVKGNVPGPEGAPVTLIDAQRPGWKAQKVFRRGRLPTGEALTGKEDDSIYLAEGVEKLPFPAGTKALSRQLPEVVEVGIV